MTVNARVAVSRETSGRLRALQALVVDENKRQNLVSAASIPEFWERHILDSVQLTHLVPPTARTWLDLGSGAGFPGLVAAIAGFAHVTLVEQRTRRAEFLAHAIGALNLEDRATVICSRLERVEARPFDVISARAFAPLGRLLDLAARFAAEETLWVLPKGKNAKTELDAVTPLWHGNFRLEPSVTDPAAAIILADHVQRRPLRK